MTIKLKENLSNKLYHIYRIYHLIYMHKKFFYIILFLQTFTIFSILTTKKEQMPVLSLS